MVLFVVAVSGDAGRMLVAVGGGARLTDAAANPEGVVGSLRDVVRGIPVPWTRADSRCKEVWSA